MPEGRIFLLKLPRFENTSTRLAILLVLASGITFSTSSIANEEMKNTLEKYSHNNSGPFHGFWEKKGLLWWQSP